MSDGSFECRCRTDVKGGLSSARLSGPLRCGWLFCRPVADRASAPVPVECIFRCASFKQRLLTEPKDFFPIDPGLINGQNIGIAVLLP
jgi:hypothetical protein